MVGWNSHDEVSSVFVFNESCSFNWLAIFQLKYDALCMKSFDY